MDSVQEMQKHLSLTGQSASLLPAYRNSPDIAKLASYFGNAYDGLNYLAMERQKPCLYVANDWDDEMDKLADVLRERRLLNHKCGIIVPTNRDLFSVANKLGERGVEVHKAIAARRGGTPPDFDSLTPTIASFGDDGDRDGWKQFLTNAQSIFQQFGDIPFIHWHHYEKTHLNDYVERYGDPEGVAARVRRNLLDLLPIARDSVLLPLSSYSLKEVEKYVGFKRSQTEYGGSWSIAKYIEATESHDENSRNKLVGEILTYNQEDLAATWAVFEWLRNKSIT
jgi:hypothetical protein